MSSFSFETGFGPSLTQGVEASRLSEDRRTHPGKPPGQIPAHTFLGFRWLQETYSKMFAMRGRRRMSVVETVSVGEKRFVSILQVDGAEYLIGGGSTVTLLTQLNTASKQLQFVDALETAQVGTGTE